MRALLMLPAALAAGGCLHLKAEPMAFRCGTLLTDHMQTYRGAPLIQQLQSFAGQDEEDAGRALFASAGVSLDTLDAAADPLMRALAAPDADRARSTANEPPATLMLSGGGSWGAFGAGFLQALGKRDWKVVTGISTGALQGLMVAAGDYDRMVREYSIGTQQDLAITNSDIGLLIKGSQYDIRPLRAKLMTYLLEPEGAELPFRRMAAPGAPHLLVGMVEGRSGDLKVVSITDMVRAVYAPGTTPTAEQTAALADCVAGVALASSSIPVRLTPVQIDGQTYMDGGVRSSVFDAGVARRVAGFARSGTPPEIYVIRNGPTVVFRDGLENGVAKVDARPDILRVGLRGYSTIVNQSELTSIAALRLIYPTGPIRVMTADGFNAPRNPERCGERPEAVFEPKFMGCLIKWGRFRAQGAPEWIELKETSPAL